MRYQQKETKEVVLRVFDGTEVFTLEGQNFEEMRSEAWRRARAQGIKEVDLLDDWNSVPV